MPAKEIMKKFREHKLHSGKGGPIVKSKAQARAIHLAYLRKEGHDIPVKGSFQQGGLVPETGAYQLHQGERVIPSGADTPYAISEWTHPDEVRGAKVAHDTIVPMVLGGARYQRDPETDVLHPRLRSRTAEEYKSQQDYLESTKQRKRGREW
jgi:hypothetical protein